MKIISLDDRCADCRNCKVWTTDHRKAFCRLYQNEQGFHPDRPVPVKCIGKVRRNY